MKLQVTKKAIRQNYDKILKIGYCKLSNLLMYENAFAYSCGIYGWSCDYYNVDNVIISTGYDPTGQNVDYKICQKYDQKARKIYDDNVLNYEQKAKKVNNLLKKFIKYLDNLEC